MPQMKMMRGLDEQQELAMAAWDGVPYKAAIAPYILEHKNYAAELIMVIAIFILVMCFAAAVHGIWHQSVKWA